MISTIDEELGIIEKYHLTPNELFITRTLLLAINGEDTYLIRYLSIPEFKETFRDMLLNLQNKGIINKSYKIPAKGERFNPIDIEFNKVFLKGFIKASFDMGKELFEIYPMFGNINGTTTSIRSVSKKFDSLEDFYRAYGKAINWNPEVHKEVMDLVEWAKDNTQYLQTTLANFVVDRKWEELKALKEGNIVNVNYDAIKML